MSHTAGPRLLNGLQEIRKEFPDMVRNVRGKGLFCAYDIVSPELRDKFIKACWAKKMLILPCGDNSVRFRPALNVPLEDIDKGLDLTRQCLKEVRCACSCK